MKNIKNVQFLKTRGRERGMIKNTVGNRIRVDKKDIVWFFIPVSYTHLTLPTIA